ncbi:MAG: glycosyltransferase family 4 protein [Tannerellaceae bacterium]|nr:glycosyltransferase family 4 protein [Tannerellaceae bacterium]
MKVLYNDLLLSGHFSGVKSTMMQFTKEARMQDKKEIEFESLNARVFGNLQSELDQVSLWKKYSRVKRIYFEHFLLKKYFTANKFDLLHSSGYILPFGWDHPSIITIHDIIAIEYPELCSTLNRWYFRFFLPQSICNSTKIIAVSHTVKQDIVKRFKVNPAKVEVIYHGVNSEFKEITSTVALEEIRRRYDLPSRFILYLGNIEPKKNLVRLIKAYQQLIRETGWDYYLVIAGRLAWKYQDVLQEIGKVDDQNRIRLLDFIPQRDLPFIYNLADLFVFPSLYEGFGLPPLEAMACKVPVVVSNRGALPEVTGHNALLVDPYSIHSIAKGMYDTLVNESLKMQVIKKGYEHVQSFSWSQTWSQTEKLYRNILTP